MSFAFRQREVDTNVCIRSNVEVTLRWTESDAGGVLSPTQYQHIEVMQKLCEETEMVLWKTVGRSFSVATIGLALSGVAVGQVAGPGLGNGSIDPDAQIDANVTADAAAAADTNATSNVDKALGAQNDGVQLDSDATAGTNRPNLNTDVQSSSDAEVIARQNRIEGSQTSNAAANSNPFGATFHSQTTDRLVIQELQPNSTASRLGLQAGDRIIGFNGQTYNDVSQFDRDLARLDRNSDFPMIYERDGKRYTQRFRMPASDVQQSFNDGSNGNQAWNGQSGSGFHSANRPVYGASYNNGNSGGMYHGQNHMGVTGGIGNGSEYGSACCGGMVQVQHSYSGHSYHGRHHGGRRHRNRCR